MRYHIFSENNVYLASSDNLQAAKLVALKYGYNFCVYLNTDTREILQAGSVTRLPLENAKAL